MDIKNLIAPPGGHGIKQHKHTHVPTCSQSVSATRSIIVPTSRNSPEYFTYAQVQRDSSATPMIRLARAASVLSPMKPVTPETTYVTNMTAKSVAGVRAA